METDASNSRSTKRHRPLEQQMSEVKLNESTEMVQYKFKGIHPVVQLKEVMPRSLSNYYDISNLQLVEWQGCCHTMVPYSKEYAESVIRSSLNDDTEMDTS